MRLRAQGWVLHVPVLEYGVAALAAFGLVGGAAESWLRVFGIAGFGLVMLAVAAVSTRLTRVLGDTIVVRSPVRRDALDRRATRLANDVRHGARGWVRIELVLRDGHRRAVVTELAAIGYPAAARRARRLGQAIAADLGVAYTEEGLEAAEFEAELAARERRNLDVMAIGVLIMFLVAVGGALALQLWLTSR